MVLAINYIRRVKVNWMPSRKPSCNMFTFRQRSLLSPTNSRLSSLSWMTTRPCHQTESCILVDVSIMFASKSWRIFFQIAVFAAIESLTRQRIENLFHSQPELIEDFKMIGTTMEGLWTQVVEYFYLVRPLKGRSLIQPILYQKFNLLYMQVDINSSSCSK